MGGEIDTGRTLSSGMKGDRARRASVVTIILAGAATGLIQLALHLL